MGILDEEVGEIAVVVDKDAVERVVAERDIVERDVRRGRPSKFIPFWAFPTTEEFCNMKPEGSVVFAAARFADAELIRLFRKKIPSMPLLLKSEFRNATRLKVDSPAKMP